MPIQADHEQKVAEARRLAEQDTRLVVEKSFVNSLVKPEELAHYNTETVQAENTKIDSLLEQADVRDQLTVEEQAKLRNAQSRNSSYLLLNNNKFSGDSGLMGAVKSTIAALEDSLRNLSGEPENFAQLEKEFSNAMMACNNYIEKKNPMFSTGKKRKRMVEQQLEKLVEDLKYFSIGKEKLKGMSEYPARCMDILILGRKNING